MKKFFLLVALLFWCIFAWCAVDTTDEDLRELKDRIEYLENQVEDLESTISDVSGRVDEACEYHWC